jgi:paraquat-inducible protein B
VKTKVSPTVVGFFVLGAFFLGIIALLSFGSFNFLTKPEQFVVYFDESVSGLDQGSPVKFRGVRVGRVAKISVTYNADTKQSVVAVLCEFNRNVLTDTRGKPIQLSNRNELEDLIAAGLRAELGILGLATGLLYVELDMKDPLEYPVPRRDLVPIDYAIIPAAPSAISEFQASFAEILANIKDVDFAALTTEMHGLLTDTREQIQKLDTATISTEITATAQAYREIAQSPHIPSILQKFDTALDNLTSTLQEIEGSLKPTAAELALTLQRLRGSLDSLETATDSASRFIASQSGLGTEAADALRQLGEAARAVGRLADYLERNPNALLSGRVPPRE